MLIDKRLKIFLTVAEQGSFSQAARKISLAQSVVSHHVDTLEKELGVSLFRKQGRGITLTEQGEVLFAEGNKLLREAQHAEDAFSRQSDRIARTIHLAADALTCSYTLPWALAEFRALHPEVHFSFRYLKTDEIIQNILSGNVDMALVGHALNHRKLDAEPCFQDEILLVGSARTAPSRVTLEELKQMQLLWYSRDPGLEQLLDNSLSSASMPSNNLDIFMEVEDLPLLLTFVRTGVGYAFLPKVSVDEYLESGELKRVEVVGLNVIRTNYRTFLKTEPTRKIVADFLEFVRSAHWGEATISVSN